MAAARNFHHEAQRFTHLAVAVRRIAATMRCGSMRKRLIIIGAICLLLAAAFLAGVTVFIFQARKTATTQIRTDSASASTSPFANMPESAIPGRYKWISGAEENFITLYENHSLLNKDGTILPIHRWDLTPDGLVLRWKNNDSVFDQIEAPGIYTGPKSDGTRRRMEKQPADPADLVKPARPLPSPEVLPLAAPTARPEGDVVAFIRFGAICETNKLKPTNTGGGDGKIFPGNVGGTDCYQLVRKPARPEAYLYLRIDPELKEPPFATAMVIVEYFDAAPADTRRGSFTIQYDAQVGAYQPVSPRVPLAGSETWKEAAFVLGAPAFQNRQNAQGDFRLCAANPDLFVRSVKLVKNPGPPAN